MNCARGGGKSGALTPGVAPESATEELQRNDDKTDRGQGRNKGERAAIDELIRHAVKDDKCGGSIRPTLEGLPPCRAERAQRPVVGNDGEE